MSFAVHILQTTSFMEKN